MEETLLSPGVEEKLEALVVSLIQVPAWQGMGDFVLEDLKSRALPVP